jgi:hypothetical protein
MCAVWRQAESDIRQAYASLVQVGQRLNETFKESSLFDLDRRDYCHYEKPDETLKQLKKTVWSVLVDRMGLRQMLSIARCEQLDKQLETGEGLPEIEESQIIAMLEGTANNIPLYVEEMTKEVFEYLRPHYSEHKTNSEFEIGSKVILKHVVDLGYGKARFRVSHWREQKLRAIDNVFHALDGGGIIKTHGGPLVDAINMSESGSGETVYFRFRSHKNGNLHLEFKRLDLLAKLNAISGGMRLKPEN